MDASGTPSMALRNIETVVQLEQQAARRRSPSDRIADTIAGFVGTVAFVVVHLVVLAGWIAVNVGAAPVVPAFDPYPFQLMCMIVSIEGVLLSAFVLIKQNRMSARADERDQIALQVALLSEQEVTKVIVMLEAIGSRLGVADQVVDAEAQDLGRHTAVHELAERLRERLPPEP